MAEIKAIYEEHKHRYCNRCITAELRRRGLLVNHKWYSDIITEFKLKGQKTYLSPIIDGCTQEIVSYTISRSPNLKQTMDMLRQAWRKHPALNGLIFQTDQGW